MGAVQRPARRGIAYVAARDPVSEAVVEHLVRCLAAESAAGDAEECRLLAGSGVAQEGGVDRAAALVYAAAARSADPRDPVDLVDARAVLFAAAEVGVPHIVVLSSTEAIHPSHHHPGLLSEDRFQPRPGDNPWSEAWRALEGVAAEATARDGGRLTILRAAPVPVPGGRDFFSRLLDGPVALTVPGYDPSLQLLAPEDLAQAIALACTAPGGDGEKARNGPALYHIVPRGTAPLHRVVRLAGGRCVPVPRWLQRLGRRAFGWTGRVHGPERIDFLRHPWTAAGGRAVSRLGFVPRVSTAQVARNMGDGRRRVPDLPDADLTPASRTDRPGRGWEWGGEPVLDFDDFGMDRSYVERYGCTLFRFLHDVYWRIEVRGLEYVPRQGRGVLAGVHRGFMPFDGVMTLHLLVRETGRYPRFLLHPTLTKFPFLANFMTKLGGILACQENADWVLERNGLVGIYPEGIRGAFTPYRRAYRLGKFGRDEYVRIALRNRAPIIPFVTVGSAEIFPILGRVDWGWWKRVSEWPYLPITPTFPLLPVPLPSKWHTRILEPYHVEELHGPDAANDRRVVAGISREIRRRMASAIDEMLARRRSIFFGSVFDT